MILRLFVLISLFIPSHLSSQESLSLKLVRQEGVTNDLAQYILTEAYRRAGIPVFVQTVPAGRALEELTQGRADGDVARIDGLEQRYPVLKKIPVALVQTEGYAFSLSALSPMETWKDLSKFRVAFRRGLQFAEVGTQGFKVERPTSEEQAFRMLEMKRVDVVLSGYHDGWETARKLNLAALRTSPLPMEKIHLFHYLHKDLEVLIPRITGILKRMESEGELVKMKKEFLAKKGLE